MYSVYIIYSKKLDRYYVGYTESIEKRLYEHNAGISTYTSKAEDWVLKYREEYAARSEAIKRESAIKKKKSRSYLEWLIETGKV